MFRKPLIALAVSLMVFMPMALPAHVQYNPTSTLQTEPGQPVDVPTEYPVWGGMSLTVVLNFVVLGLRAIGVIKEGTPLKKSIGVLLVIIGASIGAAYGAQSGVSADLIAYLKMIFGGAFAGASAVGIHSALKNFGERKK